MNKAKMRGTKRNGAKANAAVHEKKLVAGIKAFFKSAGKKKAVVGLSGGIDSAVVLSLLVKTLGKENVAAIMMPNTSLTHKQNMVDAQNLATELGVTHFAIEIDDFLHTFAELPWSQSEIARANLNARVRAVILYNYANSNDALVAGTGNKSELYMGYFTKYGDAAADFFPIADLYKKDVRALAEHMGLPREFLEKVPSAELWEGQEDEKEMGMTYEVLDELLPLILAGKKIPKEKRKIAEKISKVIKATEHKRAAPPILRV
ncbi:MAG TPA: NAD+ synthase [archaeon]|nr:NAD+ synthase [archaeon]